MAGFRSIPGYSFLSVCLPALVGDSGSICQRESHPTPTHPPTVSRLKTNSVPQMKAVLSAQNEKVVAFGLISPKMFVFNGEKVDSIITIHLERARCCDLLSSALKSPPISSHS